MELQHRLQMFLWRQFFGGYDKITKKFQVMVERLLKNIEYNDKERNNNIRIINNIKNRNSYLDAESDQSRKTIENLKSL